MKRRYQTAMDRLPYGIPSEALKGKDHTELATVLTTREKRTLPDGREVTGIGGRWYYSDPGDSSTFLKEHGAKPKEEKERRPRAVTTDKDKLLAKLEDLSIHTGRGSRPHRMSTE